MWQTCYMSNIFILIIIKIYFFIDSNLPFCSSVIQASLVGPHVPSPLPLSLTPSSIPLQIWLLWLLSAISGRTRIGQAEMIGVTAARQWTYGGMIPVEDTGGSGGLHCSCWYRSQLCTPHLYISTLLIWLLNGVSPVSLLFLTFSKLQLVSVYIWQMILIIQVTAFEIFIADMVRNTLAEFTCRLLRFSLDVVGGIFAWVTYLDTIVPSVTPRSSA